MRNVVSIVSVVFSCVACFLMPVSNGFSETKVSRHENKKLLSVLNYDWSSAKHFEKKEEALERVKKLRKLLQGLRGEKGGKGPIGKAGPAGKKGEKGPKGDKGVPGERGAKGERGQEGPMGPAGNVGPMGPKGATGPKGIRGLQGLCGPTGASSTVVEEGVLNVIFRPHGGEGSGHWHAIVIAPSGKKFFTSVEEKSVEDVKIVISPVEIGSYTVCWRNGFEASEAAVFVLREIEIESLEFNGDNLVYRELPSSKKGEQRTLCHVVVQEAFASI